MLQGKARLELSRNGKVVHRVEKKNTITGWHKYSVCRGDFNGGLDGLDHSKVMPLTNWFGGCYLTDVPNPNNDDVPGFFGMIKNNANIVAMAGNDAYSATNTRRGYADWSSGMTGPITNGYRFVFRWDETHGNGHIESVMLTRPALGKLHFLETGSFDYEVDPTLPVNYANDILTDGTVVLSSDLANINVIDYENEKGYKVWYVGDSSSGDIHVIEYALNTKRPHLTGSPWSVREQIGTEHVINVASGVKAYALDQATVVFTGDKLHLVTFPTGNGKVNDYVIDPTDYTALSATYERNYADLSFKTYGHTFVGYGVLQKDGMMIEYESGTPFLYAMATVGGTDKLVKCNLTSDAIYSEVATSPIQPAEQYLWLKQPNGDYFLRDMQSTDALWFHNNRLYKTVMRDDHILGNHYQGIQGGATYGTAMFKLDTNRPDPSFYTATVDALFGWGSTVANLDTAVDKNASLTMTLVYEITEV